MAQYAELDGNAITSATVIIPMQGAWVADVTIASAAVVGQRGTLEFAGLTLACSLVRGSEMAGVRSVRVVGGAGGWRTVVQAREYHVEPALYSSVVVDDAAREVGETIVRVDADTPIGTSYIRRHAVAGLILRDLCPNWYVRQDGATVLGTRQTGIVAKPFTVISQDGALGSVTVAADDVSDTLPGMTLKTVTAGDIPIGCVVHRLQGTSLRTTILRAE